MTDEDLCRLLDKDTTHSQKCDPGDNMTNRKNLLFIIGKIKYNTLKYGITITIDPKFPYKNRRFKSMADSQKHDTVKIIIEKYMLKTMSNIQYILIPEYSDNNGMLHYHGIVWNCYQLSFSNFLRKLRGTIGYCKGEFEIKHYDKWLSYIFKNYGKSGLSTITRISEDVGTPEGNPY